MIDITAIAEAIISLVVLVVGAFLVPLIKRKIDAATLNKILKYIEVFVGAAEQLYDKEQGEEKKAYVLAKLAEKGYILDGSIDAKIESAVLELHNKLKN